jgi:general secretion pathway protein A
VLGSGVYFVPDHLKNQVGTWIGETYRSYFPVSGTADVSILAPDEDPDASTTAIAADLPLRMPRRPPEVSFSAPVGDLPVTAPPATMVSAQIPPATAVTASSPEPPDPADAIDWLLKKRRQESGQ